MVIIQAALLAGKQLLHNKIRLAVGIAGIAFAVLLVFMQTGFRDAIFRAAILTYEQLDADLVLTDPFYANIGNPGKFSRRHLYRCLSVEGIESVNPLYITRGKWKNPVNGILSTITVFGVDPHRPGFLMPEVWENRDRLHRADALLFDVCSRPRYGPIAETFKKDGSVPVIVNEMDMDVAGLYRLGKPFDVDGTMMVSGEGFMKLFPERGQGMITLGLIRVRDNVAVSAVRESMDRLFKGELTVHTKQEFIQVEYDYTDRHNPIGFVFNLGTIMGMIVGIVIVYQVLFTDVSEHFAEYATLKAMGYSNVFLFTVVGMESLALAVAGFIPGLLVSWGLYQFTASATSLPIFMTVAHVIRVLFFTIGMCALSGGIALYKVAQADPAEVF